jgi:hypothetical protein
MNLHRKHRETNQGSQHIGSRKCSNDCAVADILDSVTAENPMTIASPPPPAHFMCGGRGNLEKLPPLYKYGLHIIT